MEVATAFRRELLRTPEVVQLVGQRIYRDRLDADVWTTGTAAIVVRAPDGGWAVDPNPRGHREYPIATVKVYADHTRDDQGLMVRADASDRARAVTRAVLARFGGAQPGEWGRVGSTRGLQIGGCQVYAPTYLVDGGRDPHGIDSTALSAEVVTAVTQFALTCYT